LIGNADLAALAAREPAQTPSVLLIPALVEEAVTASPAVLVDVGAELKSRRTPPAPPLPATRKLTLSESVPAAVLDPRALSLEPVPQAPGPASEIRPIEPVLQALAAAQQCVARLPARGFLSPSPLSVPVVDRLFDQWQQRWKEPESLERSFSAAESAQKDPENFLSGEVTRFWILRA
jgi:hypothetical protein